MNNVAFFKKWTGMEDNVTRKKKNHLNTCKHHSPLSLIFFLTGVVFLMNIFSSPLHTQLLNLQQFSH